MGSRAFFLLIITIIIGCKRTVQPLMQREIGDEDGFMQVNKFCESWRMNVEMNTSHSWSVIPSGCESHVSDYVKGIHYRLDVEAVCKEAERFAESVKMKEDGKDAWIFDIDETALSNIPYYVSIQFGLLPFSHESWLAWEEEGIADPLEPLKSLYEELMKGRWAVFFLSGRHETRRNVTERNLIRAGYTKWAGLILREEGDEGKTATMLKSSKRTKIEDRGYRIWGNVGDQWSDMIGEAAGKRRFKIPNPMYYLP